MLIRPERPADLVAISAVHAAAFANPDVGPTGCQCREPLEVRLVNELRTGPDWLERLSLVAVEQGEGEHDGEGEVVADGVLLGHVCCSRGRLDGVAPALGLGPLGVLPSSRRRGVGNALMWAVLGAAMALDEPLVCVLGDPGFYGRFGFVPATRLGILAPRASWGDYFQALPLHQEGAVGAGTFSYPQAFDRLLDESP
jgi:putative acetyltransferase